MQDSFSNKSSNSNEEIDLKELFHVLLQEKRFIVSVTALISIIAVIVSLLLPNVYESRSLLAPVSGSGSISSAIRSYSGLAGLAGINLPTEDEGNTAQAIEKIRSLSFFENNILPNIYLPDLMAFKSWDPETNNLAYDETIYDVKSGAWVREYSYPQQQIPSAQESFEVFTEEHMEVIEDKGSGFITLSIKHQSPYLAKQWVELAVDEVNYFYRQKDKLESQTAISYLNQQISMTSFSEIKEALAQLVQEETKKLALVEANEYYVFEYIEPPAVMEEESGPKRALICILSAILGGMLSIGIVIIRHYWLMEDSSH
jgi:hypothetical protein